MRQILPAININGKIVDQKSAAISIFNEGFLSGIGIFTTIKVRQRVPLFFEHHLNRLKTSARQLNVISNFKFQISNFKKTVYATIKKNDLANGGIRITISPGIVCIHAFTTKYHSHPLSCHSREGGNPYNNHLQKISVVTTLDTRDIFKTHKLTYRIPHLLAQEKARSKDAEDALFTQNNKLIESTTANIIAYIDKDTIITPSIFGKGLNGITRQILMENLPIQEAPIPQNTTSPLILINSLGLRIVESIDGRKINQNPEFVNLIRQTLDKAEKKYITNSSSRTK